jgi:hypothetical protein
MDDERDLSPSAVVVEASAARRAVSLTFGPPTETLPDGRRRYELTVEAATFLSISLQEAVAEARRDVPNE